MAGRQISLEAAYSGFESTAVDLFKENVLLKARLKELEGELEQLHGQSAGPPLPDPSMMGPADEPG